MLLLWDLKAHTILDDQQARADKLWLFEGVSPAFQTFIMFARFWLVQPCSDFLLLIHSIVSNNPLIVISNQQKPIWSH